MSVDLILHAISKKYNGLKSQDIGDQLWSLLRENTQLQNFSCDLIVGC